MFGTTKTFDNKYIVTEVSPSYNKIAIPEGDFDKIMDTIELKNKNIVLKLNLETFDYYFEGACPANIPDLVFTFEEESKPEKPTRFKVPASSWLK